MNAKPNDENELLRLCGLLVDEQLSETDAQRLAKLLAADSDARAFYRSYMDAHARLLLHYEPVPVVDKTAEQPVDRVVAGHGSAQTRHLMTNWRRLAPIAAAASLLLALGVWLVWSGDEAPPVAGGDPKPPVAPQDDPIEPPRVQVAGHWQITPIGNVDFRVIEPTLVRLDRGELLVESMEEEASAPPGDAGASLRVKTPHGDVVATGTKFYVGTHKPAGNRESTMFSPLTRVLVLSGVVTLTTALGSIEGTAGNLLAAEPDKAPTKIAVQANSDFAWDLYGQLAKENGGKNLFFSPYSISSALAMTAEGARGQTAKEMGTVLRLPDSTRRVGDDAQLIPWETAKMHTGMGAINKWLNRDSAQYQLHVANALWGEKTIPFRPQFVKALGGPYGAALIPADFKGNFEDERLQINAWVEDQTEERIKDLLPPGILDKLTRLVLTNAIYFKGDWSQPFNEDSTREMPFTSTDGSKARTPMMKHDPAGVKHKPGEKIEWPFGYAAFDATGKPTRGDDRNLQVLEMPYAGKELSMFVLLPSKHDGLPALEKQLSQERLDKWLGEVTPQEVAVQMPKFKMETEFALKPTLMAMGMPTPFTMGRADFTGLSDSPEAYLFYISAVQHKAFVEVNEKGTEAAAATVVVIGKGGSGSSCPTFAATRPFIFLIRDNHTGSILFLGRMMKPGG